MSRFASSAPFMVAAILAVAVGLAIWRSWRRGGRGAALWLQVPAAALLYYALFPPQQSVRADVLTVMTPGAASARSFTASAGQIVALPGARAPAGTEAAPDLATALRRHPAVKHLTIIGAGLAARDREAVAGRTLKFQPPPQQGLVALQSPVRVPLGRQWSLSGCAAAPTRRVELIDPSGMVVDAIDVDAAGRFAMTGAARGVGAVRFRLRLYGAERALLETISVPVIVEDGASLDLIVRYGALNPELKYWRRWATDAGLSYSVSAALTEGVSLRDGDAYLAPAALARADLVVIDARGWAGLDAAEKSALHAAVTQGLGLLLRADGPLTAGTAADWRELGFSVAPTATPGSVTLDRPLGLHARSAFTLAPVAVDAGASQVQLQADDGTPLAWWHAMGRGRIGLWRLVDSYRLMLLGEQERYANLWAGTLERLARPRAPDPPRPQLPGNAWVFERAVLCGLGAAASVRPPGDRAAVALAVNAEGCAGYWPEIAGWHVLQTGAASWPFYVRAADDGSSLRLALDGAATARMAGGEAGPDHAAARAALAVSTAARPPELHEPMARWPWFLAWLAVSGLLWVYERRPAIGHTDFVDTHAA